MMCPLTTFRILLLPFIVLLGSQMAQAQDAEVVDVLYCIRESVEQSYQGLEGFVHQADFAQRLLNHEDPQAINEDCQDFINQNSSNGGDLTTQLKLNFLHKNIAQSHSPAVVRLMTAFIRPQAVCERIGFIGSVGLALVSLNLKLDAGYCEAENGRRWIELSPGYGANMPQWLTAFAGFSSSQIVRDIEPTGSPFDTSAYSLESRGIVLVKGQSAPSRHSAQRDATFYAFGLALPFAYDVSSVGTQLNIGLIPLGTDNELLLELLNPQHESQTTY